MKNGQLKLCFVAILCFFLSSSSLAGDLGAEFGDRKDNDDPVKRMKELNLSEDQVMKISAMKKEHKVIRTENKQRRKKVRALKEELRNAFSEGKPDSEIILIHSKIMDLKREISDAKFQKLIHIKSILNSEQLKVFEFDDRRTR